MPTTTKSTVKYEISLSEEAWTPNGWYPKGHACYGFSYYSYGQYQNVPAHVIQRAENEGVPLREACIKDSEANYGTTVFNRHGSYKLRETTVTVTTVDETNDKETIKSKTESTHTVIFHESFRTEEETEEYYLKPEIEYKLQAAEREAKWAEEDRVRAEIKAETTRIEAEAAEKERIIERKNKSFFGRIKNMFS